MTSARPLYENQYIGTFIYSLGVISGRNGVMGDEMVNLLQQTPQDASIGDLVAKWQGSSFIIEFKRDRSGLKRERDKRGRGGLFGVLARANETPKNARFRALSKRCHFVAYAIPSHLPGKASLVFAPYSCLLEIRSASGVEHDHDLSVQWSLQGFVGKLLAERVRGEGQREFGASAEEIALYLEALARIETGDASDTSKSSTTTGGLIVNIDESGLPTLLRYDSILELQRQRVIERGAPERAKENERGGMGR